jgi:hypothetical protein
MDATAMNASSLRRFTGNYLGDSCFRTRLRTTDQCFARSRRPPVGLPSGMRRDIYGG